MMAPAITLKKPSSTQILFLIFACLLIYLPTISHPLIFLDDYEHISNNPLVLGGWSFRSVAEAFKPQEGQWMPLTWLTLITEVSIFGVNPAVMHGLNMCLHIGSAIFLFLWLRSMTGENGPSYLVALIFAVHPLNVESVAWAIELKNCLSMFLAMVALYFYSRHTRSRAARDYWWCVVALCLSLMSKALTVSLPILFILLDIWPLGRDWYRAISGKFWFFAIVAIDCVLVMAGAGMKTHVPLLVKLTTVLTSYFAGLRQILVPTGLALPYLFDPHHVPWVAAAQAFAILSLVTLLCIYKRKRHPYLLIGWLWYLVALFPTSGIVQVGNQSRADRFTYLAQLGIFMAVVWLLYPLAQRFKKTAFTAAFIGIAALVSQSMIQTSYWQNAKTLFAHSAKVMPDNPIVTYYQGVALQYEGDIRGAMQYHFQSVIKAPRMSDGWRELGVCLIQLGVPKAGLNALETAKRVGTDSARIECFVAKAKEKLGDRAGAAAACRKSVEMGGMSLSGMRELCARLGV